MACRKKKSHFAAKAFQVVLPSLRPMRLAREAERCGSVISAVSI